MQPESTGIKTWQWVVTVIVIIVLIIIGVMVFGNKGSSTPVSTTTATNTPAPASAQVNRIVMADQYPGNVAYLSSVQLQNGGWIVIKNDNNGQPGDIIGETYSPAGINPVKVTLTSPMVDGGTYYAILYTGNNSATFSATAEQPLTDANGNVIMFVFHASTSVGQNLKG